jgi:hypothetical protein
MTAMIFIGTTSALASNTQLCTVHTSLACESGWANSFHMVLAPGTNLRIRGNINILCLGGLFEGTALGLANPQSVHITSMSFTGCGTGSAHNNCTMTVVEMPLSNLLKTGLDEGIMTITSGRMKLVCSNLGINCEYDLEGTEFSAGAGHFTAEETLVTELGGKFLCPNEGTLSLLANSLITVYVLA